MGRDCYPDQPLLGSLTVCRSQSRPSSVRRKCDCGGIGHRLRQHLDPPEIGSFLMPSRPVDGSSAASARRSDHDGADRGAIHAQQHGFPIQNEGTHFVAKRGRGDEGIARSSRNRSGSIAVPVALTRYKLNVIRHYSTFNLTVRC